MTWFKVDDKLWGNGKWVAASKGARALWVAAGSWSACQETDGQIPAHVLPVLRASRTDATLLASVGFWHAFGYSCPKGCPQPKDPNGWVFHDWAEYQPDAASEDVRRDAGHKAMSEAGSRGNHDRWHVGRGLVVPTCPHCSPESGPDQVPESPPIRVLSPRPFPSLITTSEASPEVTELLDHLDQRIQSNGAKKPSRTKSNIDAMRLLIDRDNRTPEQIHRVIDWATADSFWKSNILSAAKLREKFDQLLMRSGGASGIRAPRADFPEDLIG